jgi:hypothetical protein
MHDLQLIFKKKRQPNRTFPIARATCQGDRIMVTALAGSNPARAAHLRQAGRCRIAILPNHAKLD